MPQLTLGVISALTPAEIKVDVVEEKDVRICLRKWIPTNFIVGNHFL